MNPVTDFQCLGASPSVKAATTHDLFSHKGPEHDLLTGFPVVFPPADERFSIMVTKRLEVDP